jgi:hypothetical protein
MHKRRHLVGLFALLAVIFLLLMLSAAVNGNVSTDSPFSASLEPDRGPAH